jgi:hypothetical protein
MSIFLKFLPGIFIFFFTLPIFSAESTIQIKLSNGTTGGKGSAELVRVILLKEAMLPIREVKNVSGSFSIQGLDLPEGIPVLIQATYKGASYNKMIPPVPELRKAEQELVVFDTTNTESTISTRSLLQLVKLPDSLQVFKIFIIQNNSSPPKAYQPKSGLDIYIPKEANGLTGTWTQGNSKMAIPLEFISKSETIRSIERTVLPGSTEVQVMYTIPWTDESILLQDQIFFEEKGNQRPVFTRPKDMKVSFSTDANPAELTDEIPEGLSAYMVKYSSGQKKTEISLSGGTPITPRFSDSPRQIVNGNWIPEWDTALVAVIGFLALLFSFQFITDFIKRKKINK